jgi:hypothetical protein
MKEPSPSAASIEEEDRDTLRRSKERSQGDGDVSFCSAREETDARGKVDEGERKKREIVSGLGGGFVLCY